MSAVLLEPDKKIKVGKLLCVGQNYKKHLNELKSIKSKNPLIFMKPSTSIIHEGTSIILPEFSQEVHHETELALLIGKNGKNIPKGKWKEYVVGVGIALDLTLRDIQNEAKKNGHPWTICKGFDGSCPLSKFRSLERIDDIQKLKIQLYINDELRQNGYTGDMIWSIDQLLVFISGIFTLEEGDILLTGTPAGVGKLHSGDHLHAEISEVGCMNFTVN